jgi:hypothetical protein
VTPKRSRLFCDNILRKQKQFNITTIKNDLGNC